MKRLLSILLASVLSLTMLSGCQKKSITIAVTNYPVEYLVKMIAQDKVTVTSLSDSTGIAQLSQIATADPITGETGSTPYYETLLRNASLILTLGELEPYMSVYSSTIEKAKGDVVDLSNVVALQEFKRYTMIYTSDKSFPDISAYYKGTAFDKTDLYKFDPYVWIDPTQMVSMGREILSWLNANYPEEKKFFEANFETLLNNLTNLDYEYSRFKLLSKKVSFVSMTPSFGYWQRSYYVNVYPVVLSEYGVLPNNAQLDAIKSRILSDGVQYIAHEDNLPDHYEALYQTLKSELGLEFKLSNLYQLSADDKVNGRDYVSLMNANIVQLESIAIAE